MNNVIRLLLHNVIVRTLLLGLLLAPSITVAENISVNRVMTGPVGQFAEIFFEPDQKITLAEAQQLFSQNGAVDVQKAVPNFGVGSRPYWLKLTVDNTSDLIFSKTLSVENAWLDKLAVYIFHDGKQQNAYSLGDTFLQTDRPINSRFFMINHSFLPGTTDIYLRVESIEPMLLPIYLHSAEMVQNRFLKNTYYYGFFYGFLAALTLLAAALSIGLKSLPHALFAVTTATFMAFSLAYTGHGFRWLWPRAIDWQQWATPTLLLLFIISLMLFVGNLLKIRKTLSSLFWVLLGVGITLILGLISAYQAGEINTALTLVASATIGFLLLILLLVAMASRERQPMIFMLMVVMLMLTLGFLVSFLTVIGIVPYMFWTYRAIELAMLLGAFLLLVMLCVPDFNNSRLKA